MSAAEVVQPQDPELRAVPDVTDAQNEVGDPELRVSTLISSLLDEMDNTDVDAIADAALNQLTQWSIADQHREVRRLLHALVRTNIGSRRSSALGRTARSPEGSRSAAAASSILQVVLHVGDGTRKTLGQCTIADLDFVIAEHQDAILEHTHRRDQYAGLRNALRRHKASVVADLPPDAIEKAVR